VGGNTVYPEKIHDLRQSVDFLLFSHEELGSSHIEKSSLRLEPATLEVKGKCANHFASEAPTSYNSIVTQLRALLIYPSKTAVAWQTTIK
jgi:hypothetical protein